MDKITSSLIKELLTTNELQSLGEAKDFERLVNYSVISNEYDKTFSIDNVTIGNGGDTGIDGLAIIVNGQLIESIDEISDLLEKNNFLEVDFIFIQSKTTSSFSGSEINHFLFGVKDFFEETNKLTRNEEIIKNVELSNFIYENAPRFKRNPNIKLYFATTGKWLGDNDLSGIVKSGVNELEETNLFHKVSFYPYGARELSNAYRKTKEVVTTTINFVNRITMPEINGISQAYIGLLPYSEFLKIVSNEEQNLLNVFEENVRDFQGENNDVNGGIASTLKTDNSEIFSVLNNGVTIVASTINPTGNQFTISDYQIVNGCQTSNVLFNNRELDNIQSISVPIKLIATTDDEVKTRITLATNNQTPIKKEQLASLTQFQRNLEQYYNSFEGEDRLYYERRSKQYSSDNTVLKSKIITVPYQIKSFTAMFLDEPHNVTSYFGLIVRKLNEGKIQIFNDEHEYISYYTSALAYYKLETLIKKGVIDASYRKVKFHLLLIFRLLNEETSKPSLNAKKMNAYCNTFLDILNNEEKVIKEFRRCCQILDDSGFDKMDKQEVKLVSKTKELVEYIYKMK